MTAPPKPAKPAKQPGKRLGGRKAGTPNLITREFRETVRLILEENSDKAAAWLQSVAEGDPAQDRAPDPARALDLLAKLAEFAAPKLGRVEHTGEDGGPMRQVTTIELEFVDGHAPAYEPALNGYARSPGLPAPVIDEAAP